MGGRKGAWREADELERCLGGADGRLFALMFLGPLKGDDRLRQCWLVEAGEQTVRALLMRLRRFTEGAGRGDVEIVRVKGSEDYLSPEAAEASKRAGVSCAVIAYVESWDEDGENEARAKKADRFEGVRKALRALAAVGLAEGPAEVGPNELRRFYELEAALACVAMSERRELAMSASGALGSVGETRRASLAL